MVDPLELHSISNLILSVNFSIIVCSIYYDECFFTMWVRDFSDTGSFLQLRFSKLASFGTACRVFYKALQVLCQVQTGKLTCCNY